MANEMQKMREAVVAISDAIKELRERNPKVVDCIRETIKDIENWTNYALEVRRRNCDVGTADEQSERFDKFCDEQCMKSCKACPVYKKMTTDIECFAKWAQMPYEEERKGEGDAQMY